jgi:serine/threonine protein kinase, bacterial
MTSVLCSQGHTNLPGSRFCHLCGENLSELSAQPVNLPLDGTEGVYAGLILGDRYRVVRELGHGGFGRTYLAEDINRFDEACVLKEFAPQVQGTYALQKSEELFEREAGVLYKLRHPQIPRFRELFRANLGDRGYLFLVQDFVEGYTYRQLLEARRQTGSFFSEAEIVQLLEQLLPVLHYIHVSSVIHRDISPDNLILRSSDRLPVLIDFGGVKQVAAVAASQYMAPESVHPEYVPLEQGAGVTRLGKVGYAPEEQMRSGFASPHSDLYALAMTAMVLLTGREPLELLSHPIHTWWQQFLSSPLLATLMKMLSPQPGDRFQSALEVLQALQSQASLTLSSPDASLTQAPVYTQPDFTLQPLPAQHPVVQFPNQSAESFALPNSPDSHSLPQRVVIGFLLAALLGTTGAWWTRDRWLSAVLPGQQQPEANQPEESKLEQSKFSPEEQQRKQTLQSRRQALGINQQFLVNLANATFYGQHPDQQGRTLSDDETDAKWRGIWDGLASEWLKLLEQNASSEARGKLGTYTNVDRDQWKQEVNKLYVGSRSLFDLTDAKFFHLFPQMRGKEFIEQPIGQVWQAIAFDQVHAMQSGKTLTELQFDPGSFSKQDAGNLSPGEGRIYTAQFTEGQLLRVSLQSPPQGTLFSIYPPRPGQGNSPFPEDSAEATWAGQLTQSGHYEFVVVANSADPISYQLNLAVDNVTSAPVKSPIPEAPQAKD